MVIASFITPVYHAYVPLSLFRARQYEYAFVKWRNGGATKETRCLNDVAHPPAWIFVVQDFPRGSAS